MPRPYQDDENFHEPSRYLRMQSDRELDLSRKQAIQAARSSVSEGHAIRYDIRADSVSIETDQGWLVLWPEDSDYNPAQFH